ncbi:uncharacterized protein [Euwallacea fornicatus]|uniref:uncharacterized protein n=1 Tax=Euwallacea fornicatus TaxID=995702 RepID=UPI00338FF857
MEMGYLFLLILTALNGVHVSPSTSEQGFRIYMLANDCLDKNLPVVLTNISLKLRNDTYLIKFDINATEDTFEDITLEMSVKRCLNKAARDTCEEFHKFVFPHFCRMINLPGPWLTYMKNMSPPYMCPTKKGIYRMLNSIQCKIKDMERLNFRDGYFFKVLMKSYGMESNRLYSCFKIEGQK